MGNLVWTFIIYSVTFGIVYICFQLVAEEKIEADKIATDLMFRARQADRAKLGGIELPKIAEAPVRTVGKIPFRLIR